MSDRKVSAFHYAPAPKVAFYTYPEWAFGSIHEALCREFYNHGVLAHIIDWNRPYSAQDLESFVKQYDTFVTVPGNAITLLNTCFNVPNEKIIAIAHGRYDLEYGIKENNRYDDLKGFGVIGHPLKAFSRELGISREPVILHNGVHFDLFYSEPPLSLSTLGYGGVISYPSFDKSREIKRGYLAKEVSEKTGLPLKLVEPRNFLTMPSFYKQVDCTLLTSSEESWGLPMIETAASGRLPMGTCVGVFQIFDGFGRALPIDGREFVRSASEELNRLVKDPETFNKECRRAQEFVRYSLDWKFVIDDWLRLVVS